MNNQYITVNLIPNLSAPAVACVSQYDVGRPLVFRIYNGVTSADLTGVTAVAVGTKKSGLGFSVTGTISGNTVTFSTTLEMTQESGMIPAEIRFSKTGEDIGTANFTLAVEPSPHLEGTTDGTTETMADLQSQLDALDTRVEALETGGGGLTDAIKSALLQIAQKVAYIDEYGQTYYNALYNALYPPADLVSISAVYTQSGTVYDTDSLDSLKAGLVVTANYAGGTSETVPASDYTLSGTLTAGTSTITVTYGNLTDSFTVTVTANPLPSGYTQYDYLAYDANLGATTTPIITTAQIKSEYTITARLKLLTGTNSNACPIIGTRAGSSTKQFGLFLTPTTGKLGYWYGGTDTTNEILISKDTVHDITVLPVGKSTTYPSNAVIDVDGTEHDTGSTATGQTWSAWFGLLGYASSATAGTGKNANAQLGDVTVKDANGMDVYKFVPVDSGSEKGFYDLVGGTFYPASVSMLVGNWE